MAAYSRREVTTVTVEYVLPSPAHWSEVDKAVGAASAELQAVPAGEAWFEARDGEIVIRFEKSEGADW